MGDAGRGPAAVAVAMAGVGAAATVVPFLAVVVMVVVGSAIAGARCQLRTQPAWEAVFPASAAGEATAALHLSVSSPSSRVHHHRVSKVIGRLCSTGLTLFDRHVGLTLRRLWRWIRWRETNAGEGQCQKGGVGMHVRSCGIFPPRSTDGTRDAGTQSQPPTYWQGMQLL